MKHENFIREAIFTSAHQMSYLGRYQDAHFGLETRLKEDQSIQTEPDVVSDDAGRKLMQSRLPDHRYWGEESGFTGPAHARYTALQDGLDGTTAFKQGLPTYCVGWGLHDNVTERLVAAVARTTRGHPLVYDEGAGTCAYVRTEVDGVEQELFVPLQVEPVRDLSRESVFVDISRAFTRTLITSGEKRVVMAPAQKEYFMSELQRSVKGIHIPGSNILQQMATAMRRNGAAGYFMTAAGGPQDALGVGFILAAGGTARAFDLIDGKLTEVDPLMIFGRDGNGYDLLVGARDERTAGKLVDILAGAYRR